MSVVLMAAGSANRYEPSPVERKLTLKVLSETNYVGV